MGVELAQTAKLVAFVAGLAVFFILERFAWPYARRPLFNKSHLLRNGAFVLTTVLASRWWVVPLTLAATRTPVGRPLDLPEPLLLAVHLILLDLALYVWHRLNHEIPFLWRFHEIHHRDAHMDSTTALRFHFGELMLSALFRCGVIMLLAIPFAHVLLYEALVVVCIFFHHSNIRLPTGWERRLSPYIITPGLHWMHHHKKRIDTDSNYGVSIVFWDKLFGTYTPAARKPDMPLGVEGTKGDLSLKKLMMRPFQRAGRGV